MNYERNTRYFKFPGTDGVLAIVGIFIGVILLIVGPIFIFSGSVNQSFVDEFGDVYSGLGMDDLLAGNKAAANEIGMGKILLFIGIALFAISLVFFLIKYKGISKDVDLDMQVQDAVNQLGKTALVKHGVTEEQVQMSAPIVLGGYVLAKDLAAQLFAKRHVKKETAGGKTTSTVVPSSVVMGSVISSSLITGEDIPVVNYKKGFQDIKVRTPIAEYTVLHFSGEKMFVYTQQFSLIDSEKKEQSQNYSYRDISSVSTETSNIGTHAFIIKLSTGKVLSIPCCDVKATGINESVTALMQLVRDKKN